MHTCIHAYMHTYIHAYMHTCIHAYMHTCMHARPRQAALHMLYEAERGRSLPGPCDQGPPDSFRFWTLRKIIGSFRTDDFPGSTRFGLCLSNASWLGPVRFGSFPRPVPAGSRIKRFDSVRFDRSVSYSFFL